MKKAVMVIAAAVMSVMTAFISSADSWSLQNGQGDVYNYCTSDGTCIYSLSIGESIRCDGLFEYRPAGGVDFEKLKRAAKRTVEHWPMIMADAAKLNEVRASAGLYPLSVDLDLCIIASFRAEECYYGGLDHYDSSGALSYQKLTRNYISDLPLGENIAWYQDSGQGSAGRAGKLFAMLKDSPVHYGNMVCDYGHSVGIGFYEEGIKMTECQLFSYDSGLFHYNPMSGQREQ